jgi:hypothetical protein
MQRLLGAVPKRGKKRDRYAFLRGRYMIKNMSRRKLIELTVVARSYRESGGLSSWFRIENEILAGFKETCCADYDNVNRCLVNNCCACWHTKKREVREDIKKLFT